MKKIKSRDPLIPKVAEFFCNNCNTRFESSDFEIASKENYIRDEKLPLFSKYNRIFWTKPVYLLSTDCPVCGYRTELEIDRNLPEKRNEVLQRDVDGML